MHLDLRTPIGLLFTLYGVLLSAYGAWAGASSPALYVDLEWGLVILLTGVSMLLMRWRHARQSRRE